MKQRWARSQNPGAMINFGMALSQTQQTAQALPVPQRAAAPAPTDVVTAHQNLAAALVQMNQFTDAIVELRAAATSRRTTFASTSVSTRRRRSTRWRSAGSAATWTRSTTSKQISPTPSKGGGVILKAAALKPARPKA